MPAKLTTEKFIEKARAVHGDTYDYSKTQYVRSTEKVCITCPEHGDFWQVPTSHLRGVGCPKCGYKKNHTDAANLKRAAATQKTIRERYQVDNIGQVPGARERYKQAMIEHWGVDNPSKSREIRARIERTNLERYGGTSPMASEEVREKIRATNLERYGYVNPLQNPEVSAKAEKRAVEKRVERFSKPYFVMTEEYQAKADEYRQRAHETRLATGGYGPHSHVEDRLYARLVDTFGEDDVVRGYRDEERYPYACDFYIRSRDLFIELNASPAHGGCWYETTDVRCQRQLATWLMDAAKAGYVDTWTRRDTAKRACAREHELNYVTFWNSRLHDADVWFALGMPDGRDWERTYSWLPERDLVPWGRKPLAVGSSTVSNIARRYQFDVFYARELALWRTNGPWKDTHMPLQCALYWNRMRYAQRMPLEITDHQLLSGFKIMRILQSYSRFDNTLMQMVLRDHEVHGVYDPCAGWGERMLTCAALGIPYVGVDVNEQLVDGYARMQRDYGLSQCRFVLGDAATVALEDVEADAVITCPPYGDIELYSEHGAEHYGAHQFADWWKRVVAHTTELVRPRLFCVQTNQKMRSVFLDGLVSQGYELIDELRSEGMERRRSAYHRTGASQKREFESLLVMRTC